MRDNLNMPKNAPHYYNSLNPEQIVSLGVSLSCGKQACGQVWIFDIPSQREYDEFLCACDAMAEDLDGAYCIALTFDDGALHIQITGRANSHEKAAQSINHATIAFAALAQWGCGPASGLGPIVQPQHGALLQEALALREAYQLDALSNDANAYPPNKTPTKSL